MAHSLPPLPYAFDALEPHIDKQTMEIHHGKHHAAYVNNLNAALEKHPELQSKSIEDLLKGISSVPEDIRTAVRNNGGGHANHSMFWQIMAPERRRRADRRDRRRDQRRPSAASTRSRSSSAKAGVGRFGSGWAWVIDNGGKLAIESTAEPGQPAHGRQEAGLRRRRLGARLLPEVPEPPARLHRRLVERRQLGRDQQAASGR